MKKEKTSNEAIDFAEWLAENTEIIREPKITLYHYRDSDDDWGNFVLADIYTVFRDKYEPAASSNEVERERQAKEVVQNLNATRAASSTISEGQGEETDWRIKSLQELLAHKTAVGEAMDLEISQLHSRIKQLESQLPEGTAKGLKENGKHLKETPETLKDEEAKEIAEKAMEWAEDTIMEIADIDLRSCLESAEYNKRKAKYLSQLSSSSPVKENI